MQKKVWICKRDEWLHPLDKSASRTNSEVKSPICLWFSSPLLKSTNRLLRVTLLPLLANKNKLKIPSLKASAIRIRRWIKRRRSVRIWLPLPRETTHLQKRNRLPSHLQWPIIRSKEEKWTEIRQNLKTRQNHSYQKNVPNFYAKIYASHSKLWVISTIFAQFLLI